MNIQDFVDSISSLLSEFRGEGNASKIGKQKEPVIGSIYKDHQGDPVLIVHINSDKYDSAYPILGMYLHTPDRNTESWTKNGIYRINDPDSSYRDLDFDKEYIICNNRLVKR